MNSSLRLSEFPDACVGARPLNLKSRLLKKNEIYFQPIFAKQGHLEQVNGIFLKVLRL